MIFIGNTIRYAKALSVAAALLSLSPAPARAEPPAKSESPSGFSTMYTGVPLSIGVMSILEIPELNEALAAQGLARFERLTVTLNAGLTQAFANGLVIEPQYRFTITNTEETTVIFHHALLNAGYVIVSRGDVLAYPVVGAGFGVSTLEFATVELEPSSFDEVLAEPKGDALLSSAMLILHAGFAANLWGSGHGDFLGLRTGLIFAPMTAAWKRRGYSVHGGPPPPVSGAYFAIAFGFRTPFER